MRSVSDNGATAPISALTYAFIFVSNRGHQTDDFRPKSVAAAGRVARAERGKKSLTAMSLAAEHPPRPTLCLASNAFDASRGQLGDARFVCGRERAGRDRDGHDVAGPNTHPEGVRR